MNHFHCLSGKTFVTLAGSQLPVFLRVSTTSSFGGIRCYSEKKASNGEDQRNGLNSSTQPQSGMNGQKKRGVSGRSKQNEEKRPKEGKRIKSQGWISRILTGPQGVAPRYLQSHSSLLSDSDFIYELVTHDAKPGERDNYLNLYKNYAGEIQRMSAEFDLLGSWTVFYSNRDQAVHLWRYKHGYEGIDRTMNDLLTVDTVKKLERELGQVLLRRDNVLAKSFSYWGEPKPRQPSNIYELRTYTLRPGTLIEWGAAWARGIEYRREANQDVGGFFTQIGPLHRVFHLWAYPNLMSRNETRQKMWAKPGWDQTVCFTVPLIKTMESKILVPTNLSQLQ